MQFIKSKKLIIIGNGESAITAYEYFTYDSEYEVIGFSVAKEFIKEPVFYGLPVYDFDTIEERFPPAEYYAFVAISHVKLNRVRAKMYYAVKAKGYTCANYLSSKASIWRNVELGENVFVTEFNVMLHDVKIGNNVMIRSSNNIGHRTVVKDHVWMTAHCVIPGFCEIGEYTFLGVNSTVNDYVKIARDNIIGSASLVNKNTEVGKVMVGVPARPTSKSSYETFNVNEEEI